MVVQVSWEVWARGAMDNASDYGSEDSRFESWRARQTYFLTTWTNTTSGHTRHAFKFISSIRSRVSLTSAAAGITPSSWPVSIEVVAIGGAYFTGGGRCRCPAEVGHQVGCWALALE